MCGGDIQSTDKTYGTCESCGSTMTLPRVDDDRKANLFNRANHFRLQNEFDKAAQAYENILNGDNADAEAHWGLVLSRYGIEYVEDPATHQRIPTCHRVQSDSILTDVDYMAALEHAPDEYTKSLYENEAKKISDIQKDILAISSKEKPYDVFICYKETTDWGSRTKDSTIAQDIYYQLTNDGYRVFFEKITLEDKLGRQYEPYIFSALNSAKVMLVFGTRKEHFDAVWVKNEWSRFLAIMKKDPSRQLIPCYRDMDAYDIPDELSNLQSQDMSKVTFMQEILCSVKKVLDAIKTTEMALSASAAGTGAVVPGVESLMKRGWLFLEDSDWEQADVYFDRVLDINPEYALAYTGKLCAMLKIKSEADLVNHTEPLDDIKHYQKALRFADVDYNAKVAGYNQVIKDRIAEDKRTELERIRQEEERIWKAMSPSFVRIADGTFRMGSDDHGSSSSEKPVHKVKVSGFSMANYLITQREWIEVMGNNPSNFKGGLLPVESVSWYEAVEFCNRLSEKERLTPAYTIDGENVNWDRNANGYRLPTEAEWEYAARGGDGSPGYYTYSGSSIIDEVAWYEGNSEKKTHPIGTKKANGLGLYDMSGNVWEWCWDWYGAYPRNMQTDPVGISSGSKRVARGGSWGDSAEYVRSTLRLVSNPSYRSSSHGIRLVRPGTE
jgi:formylglycine-generating enzyme required for sulfatase activity